MQSAFLSLAVFLSSLLLIEFFFTLNSSPSFLGQGRRSISSLRVMKASWIFILRNRSAGSLNFAEFFVLLLLVFSSLVSIYWVIGDVRFLSSSYRNFLLPFPCFVLVLSALYYEITESYVSSRKKLCQIFEKIFFLSVALFTVSTFKIASAIIDTSFDTLLMITGVLYLWFDLDSLGYRTVQKNMIANALRITFFYGVFLVFSVFANIQIYGLGVLSVFLLLAICTTLLIKINNTRFQSFKISSTKIETFLVRISSLICVGKICLSLMIY